MISGSDTLINKVRVAPGSGDPLSLRPRLRHVLSNLNLTPDGLSPEAIVCIRRLTDPRPGLLDLATNTLQPALDWQRAVQKQVADLISKSARSPVDPIPPDAECVVFAGKAALLAALAGDWCEGNVTTRWWWQALLKGVPVASAWLAVWRNAPEYIPAALQQLAVQRRIDIFARALSGADADALFHDIGRSFALQALVKVLHFGGPDEFEASGFGVQRSMDGEPRAPWRRWAPETMAVGLGPRQQRFLGIALMVQRAPAIVRSSSFAAELKSWQQEIAEYWTRDPGRALSETGNPGGREQSFASAVNPEVLAGDIPSLAGSQPAAEAIGLSGPATAMPGNKVSPDDGKRGDSSFVANDTAEPIDPAPLLLAEVRPAAAPVGTQASSPELVAPVAEVIPTADGELRTAMEDAQGAAAAEGPYEPAVVDHLGTIEVQAETEFGGLFYLINLALRLGLYGDFSTPAEPGIQLDIWDFVALVGRELVGNSVQSDPVWQLLTVLNGRAEDTEPGYNFEPDDQWRVPQAWLQPFATERCCYWTLAGRRLCLFHPDQFLLLDVSLQSEGEPPSEAAAEQQLRSELSTYESFGFRVSSFELSKNSAVTGALHGPDSRFGTPPLVAAWLNRLLPYVRARLRKAFGTDALQDPGAVFRCHARVVGTATHLNVFLALADLPIEIRLAGLDRNPGWLPAAGRFIAFRFE